MSDITALRTARRLTGITVIRIMPGNLCAAPFIDTNIGKKTPVAALIAKIIIPAISGLFPNLLPAIVLMQ